MGKEPFPIPCSFWTSPHVDRRPVMANAPLPISSGATAKKYTTVIPCSPAVEAANPADDLNASLCLRPRYGHHTTQLALQHATTTKTPAPSCSAALIPYDSHALPSTAATEAAVGGRLSPAEGRKGGEVPKPLGLPLTKRPIRSMLPPSAVLLRHTWKGRTKTLYADGRVEEFNHRRSQAMSRLPSSVRAHGGSRSISPAPQPILSPTATTATFLPSLENMRFGQPTAPALFPSPPSAMKHSRTAEKALLTPLQWARPTSSTQESMPSRPEDRNRPPTTSTIGSPTVDSAFLTAVPSSVPQHSPETGEIPFHPYPGEEKETVDSRLNLPIIALSPSNTFDTLREIRLFLQKRWAPKLEKQQRTFHRQHARPLTSSQSVLSLEFPFRPLSAIFTTASSASSPIGNSSPTAPPHRIGSSQSGCSSLGDGVLGQGASVPEVLLPASQIQMPCGWTVPELLQRLIQREPKGTQHRLMDLMHVRGLVDEADSPASRFTISFVWFVLLRCRRVWREETLISGYQRLSKMFFEVFPYFTREALPPFDILDNLLLDLETLIYFDTVPAEGSSTTSHNHDNVDTAHPSDSDAEPMKSPPRSTKTCSPAGESVSRYPLGYRRSIQGCNTGATAAAALHELLMRNATVLPTLAKYPQLIQGSGLILPTMDSFASLRSIYYDLFLIQSEYAELCLYEEQLYKRLATLFGEVFMSLNNVTKRTGATVAAAASPIAGPSGRRMTPSAAALSSGSSHVIRDGILESFLSLVAHQTYFNCVFCFPNDTHAGLFDEEFRADVVRWLSYCCHGVAATHVMVKRWPTPIQQDAIDIRTLQSEREAATAAALWRTGSGNDINGSTGLDTVTTPFVVNVSSQGVIPFTGAPTPFPNKPAAPKRHRRHEAEMQINRDVMGAIDDSADDDDIDGYDVTANSIFRMAHKMEGVSRNAAAHVKELERKMARVHRRQLGFPAANRQRRQFGSFAISNRGGKVMPLDRELIDVMDVAAQSTVSSTAVSPCLSHVSGSLYRKAGYAGSSAVPSPTRRCLGDGETSTYGAPSSSSYSINRPVSQQDGGRGGDGWPSKPSQLTRGRRGLGGASRRRGTIVGSGHGTAEDARSQYATQAAVAMQTSLVAMATNLEAQQKGGDLRQGVNGGTSGASSLPMTLMAPGHAGDDVGYSTDDFTAPPISASTNLAVAATSMLSSYPFSTCPRDALPYLLRMLVTASWPYCECRYRVTHQRSRSGAAQLLSTAPSFCQVPIPPISDDALRAEALQPWMASFITKMQRRLYRRERYQRSPLAVAAAAAARQDNRPVSGSNRRLSPAPSRDYSSSSARDSPRAERAASQMSSTGASNYTIQSATITAAALDNYTPAPAYNISVHRRKLGPTYLGCTSPFITLYAAYLAAQTKLVLDDAEKAPESPTPLHITASAATLGVPPPARDAGTPSKGGLLTAVAAAKSTSISQRGGSLKARTAATPGAESGLMAHYRTGGRTTFTITAIPRQDAKPRPHILGPLQREALRRRDTLLGDLSLIVHRDGASRLQYIVNHLKSSNAMTTTSSDYMMRRYRARARLALEKLATIMAEEEELNEVSGRPSSTAPN